MLKFWRGPPLYARLVEMLLADDKARVSVKFNLV